MTDISTLRMASAQVVETSVEYNSPSQDSNHPDDRFQSRSFEFNEKTTSKHMELPWAPILEQINC